jgi:hypothetical protein
LGVARF